MRNSLRDSPPVYFFSHTGDLFRMRPGSTVLDFAYRVHTELGNRAISAEVNEVSAHLDHEIREGERVKIIAGKTGSVQKSWLRFLVTDAARKNVTDYLKKYGKE